MSSETNQEGQEKNGSESGLSFLEGIAHRHDELLAELDQLNDRIERVLQAYQSSRSVSQESDGWSNRRAA